MERMRSNSLLRFLAFFLLFSLACLGFFSLAQRSRGKADNDASSPGLRDFSVVLDAGHGGEDGGAVSESGICEKAINLSIACYLRDYLESSGIRVVMTREEDVLLYDRTVDFHGRKKQLDLLARREIAEMTANSIFVSIHMNAFPSPQYRGLQVWFSPNHSDSALLADRIRDTVQSYLQPENHRPIKQATSSIYLLHHIASPAVLVECGFLSNPEEAALLAKEEYQRELAFLLFCSILQERGVRNSV